MIPASVLSVLAEREEEDYPAAWSAELGLDPNQDRERDTDSFALLNIAPISPIASRLGTEQSLR